MSEAFRYSEDELLPISALQHLLFCERQCALIHIEQQWADNRLTVEGEQLHEKVHGGSRESRGEVRIVRTVPLRSLRLGLVGVADTVEFRRVPVDDTSDTGVTLDDAPGRWLPFPVEFKRGRPKRDGSDEVQLCAQALCLEEALNVAIPAGAIFYRRTNRRSDVSFDAGLRRRTVQAAVRLHDLIAAGITPSAVREPKCERCSLLDLCLPDALSPRRSVQRYLDRALA